MSHGVLGPAGPEWRRGQCSSRVVAVRLNSRCSPFPPPATRPAPRQGPGGAAELGGMKRGDVLIRLGSHEVGSVEDLMYALNAVRPGETMTAVVLRDGKEVKLQVTYQESKRR
ncbi:PDZ domain-containing protein [Archangium minus]|uniref:PDZ domain-containing protein n=1 Tax=Archangium minus TaxID=83450 RepID=UPI0037C06057